MEKTKKSTGIYWVLFLLSLAAFIVFAIPPYQNGVLFNCSIPFVGYFFVKAMDMI